MPAASGSLATDDAPPATAPSDAARTENVWPWKDGIPASRTCLDAEQLSGLEKSLQTARACMSAASGELKVTVLVRPGGELRRVLLEGSRTAEQERCVKTAFSGIFFDCARATGFVRTMVVGVSADR